MGFLQQAVEPDLDDLFRLGNRAFDDFAGKLKNLKDWAERNRP
jgi:hypothetical protein